MADCPICRKKAAERSNNPTFPFCSPRCKTIDLGKWLSEDYRVPVEGEGSEDDSSLEGESNPEKAVRH